MPANPAATDSSTTPATAWVSLVVWILVTVAVTVLSILLIPLTTPGGFPVPVALVVVAVANVALPRTFLRGIGTPGAQYIPGLLWLVITLISASPTRDGDLLIPSTTYSSVMGMIYLGLGAVTATIGMFTANVSLRSLTGRKPAS